MKKIDSSKLKQELKKLNELLRAGESFPLKYTFKFIVPTAELSQILGLFPNEENITTKASSKGTYISVTIIRMVQNANEVTRVYESVSVIDGVISL